MSTYGIMQTRINDELALPSVVGRIKPAILSAIRFYEQERFWFLEGEATASTVADQANYATPTDLLQTDEMTLTDSSTRHSLRKVTWAAMRNLATSTSSTSRPKVWSLYANEYWLYPVPDAVYTLTSSYLLRLTALSAVDDTNDWMTHGEELIRSRSKYDLLLNSARDFEGAAAMKQAARDAYDNLLTKSNRKIRTPTLSLDSALVSPGGFNINTG